MGNHLYLVRDGRAERLEPGHRNPLWQRGPVPVWEPDIVSVLALAEDHAGALALARAYDRGEIWPDDVKLAGGQAVFALRPQPAPCNTDGDASMWETWLVIGASAVAGLILFAAAAAIVLCAARGGQPW